jgi:hypothetical protein
MLELRLIDASILERIKPVSDALISYGIKSNILPKEARRNARSQPYYISVVTPQCKGQQPDEQNGIQEVNYLTYVKISVQNLFPEGEEIDALYWVIDQILGYLIGFIPFADKTDSRRSLWFDGYDLMKPDDGTWECELRFQSTKLLRVDIELGDEDDKVDSVEIFTSTTLSELDALLVTKVP